MTRPSRRLPFRSLLDGLSSLAMIAASATLMWAVLGPARSTSGGGGDRSQHDGQVRQAGPSVPVVPLSWGALPTLGEKAAGVGVIEFSDYQCPYCVKYSSSTFPEVKKLYIDTGKVRYAVWSLPLEELHPSAFRMAEAAECGRLQGRFWTVHEALLQKATVVDVEKWATTAAPAGLDRQRFQSCMNGEAVGRLRSRVREAQSAGVSATPTFFFGYLTAGDALSVVRRETGAIPTEAFRKILDTLIADAARRAR
jgi:protein-disulfide isomerase